MPAADIPPTPGSATLAVTPLPPEPTPPVEALPTLELPIEPALPALPPALPALPPALPALLPALPLPELPLLALVLPALLLPELLLPVVPALLPELLLPELLLDLLPLALPELLLELEEELDDDEEGVEGDVVDEVVAQPAQIKAPIRPTAGNARVNCPDFLFMDPSLRGNFPTRAPFLYKPYVAPAR
jgi:hypothetical protein